MKVFFFKFSVAIIIFTASFLVLAFSKTIRAVEGNSSLPESRQIIQNCWSEDELNGNPKDKKIITMPSGPLSTCPVRLQPSVIGPELPAQSRYSIRRVKLSGEQKLLALTFDLCEREKETSGYDFEIVNFLRANKIKATFFACGKWMQSHPKKTMQLMADPLFEIGNHGWSHRNMRLLDKKAAEEEILWTQAQYELIWEELQKRPCVQMIGENSRIPRVPQVFRFPFGTCDSEVLSMLQHLGLAAIQWDVVSGDAAKGQTASAIANIIMKQAKPGSIIVFHANGRGHGTAESLPMFIPKLKKDGFSFVTVSELLSLGLPVAVPECYELKPKDNLRYDKLFSK